MYLEKKDKYNISAQNTICSVAIKIRLKSKNENTQYPNLWNEYRFFLIELISNLIEDCVIEDIPEYIDSFSDPEDKIFYNDIIYDDLEIEIEKTITEEISKKENKNTKQKEE